MYVIRLVSYSVLVFLSISLHAIDQARHMTNYH